ncbi:MAG: hypothetical protein R2748_29010 [Bryobacterales bacterium]
MKNRIAAKPMSAATPCLMMNSKLGSLLAVVAEKTIAKPKKVNSRMVKQSVRS